MNSKGKYLKYKKKYMQQKLLLPILPAPQLVPLISNVLPLKPEIDHQSQSGKVLKSDKVIVKQFNGAVNLNYFQIEELKMNMLVFSTEHDYEPKNQSYCQPCESGCYNLIEFIKQVSKTRY